MKKIIFGCVVLLTYASSALSSSSEDSFEFFGRTSSISSASDESEEGGRQNLTPRSCSYTEWLDILGPKRQKVQAKSATTIFDGRDELYELKEKLDDSRWALRYSAEQMANLDLLKREEEQFLLEVDYWAAHFDEIEKAKTEILVAEE